MLISTLLKVLNLGSATTHDTHWHKALESILYDNRSNFDDGAKFSLASYNDKKQAFIDLLEYSDILVDYLYKKDENIIKLLNDENLQKEIFIDMLSDFLNENYSTEVTPFSVNSDGKLEFSFSCVTGHPRISYNVEACYNKMYISIIEDGKIVVKVRILDDENTFISRTNMYYAKELEIEDWQSHLIILPIANLLRCIFVDLIDIYNFDDIDEETEFIDWNAELKAVNRLSNFYDLVFDAKPIDYNNVDKN